MLVVKQHFPDPLPLYVGRRRQEDNGGGRDGRGSGGGGDAADDHRLRRQRKHRQPEPGGGTETHIGEIRIDSQVYFTVVGEWSLLVIIGSFGSLTPPTTFQERAFLGAPSPARERRRQVHLVPPAGRAAAGDERQRGVPDHAPALRLPPRHGGQGQPNAQPYLTLISQ